MTYKINVYEMIFFNVATNKGMTKKHYFKKVETIKGIKYQDINKNYQDAFKRYTNTMYHITLLRADEPDNLIEEHNRKMRKYMQLMGV